jgi:hypothetical protein
MQAIASLLVFLLLLGLSGTAWAGNRPNVSVAEDPQGVHASVDTPASPATSHTPNRRRAPADSGDTTSVSCAFTPTDGPGLAFTASCSDQAATRVLSILDVQFVTPTVAQPTVSATRRIITRRPVVSPETLARQASQYLPLPLPIIRTNPDTGVDQLVNLEIWLWIDQASWGRRTATASVPGLSVTVVATPLTVTWRPGDGTVQVCNGPGTAYDPGRGPDAQQPTCAHTYRSSSLGQPAGRYQMTATITWQVSWTASGLINTTGTLPPITRTSQASLRVIEAQTLN